MQSIALREGRPAEAAEVAAPGQRRHLTSCAAGSTGSRSSRCATLTTCFAGVLEVMAHGRYFWVGLEQVRLVTMNPPRFPRDLLFIPAHLELDDEQGDVFVPALYPGSHEHADDQVRLGRMTDWKELDGGLLLGVGLHTFVHDDDAIGLLEWREWRSDHESAE